MTEGRNVAVPAHSGNFQFWSVSESFMARPFDFQCWRKWVETVREQTFNFCRNCQSHWCHLLAKRGRVDTTGALFFLLSRAIQPTPQFRTAPGTFAAHWQSHWGESEWCKIWEEKEDCKCGQYLETNRLNRMWTTLWHVFFFIEAWKQLVETCARKSARITTKKEHELGVAKNNFEPPVPEPDLPHEYLKNALQPWIQYKNRSTASTDQMWNVMWRLRRLMQDVPSGSPNAVSPDFMQELSSHETVDLYSKTSRVLSKSIWLTVVLLCDFSSFRLRIMTVGNWFCMRLRRFTRWR